MKELGRGSHGSVYAMDDFLNTVVDFSDYQFFTLRSNPKQQTQKKESFKQSLLKIIAPLKQQDFIVKELDDKTFEEEKEYNKKALEILGTNHSLLHPLIGFRLGTNHYICNIKGKEVAFDSVTQIKKFCYDILACLTILGKHGYSHNDVKLDNTMFHSKKNIYVLIDFGKLNKSDEIKLDNICGFNRDSRLFELIYAGKYFQKGASKLCRVTSLKIAKKKKKQLGKQWYIEVYKTPFWILWNKYRRADHSAFINNTTDKSLRKKLMLKYSDLYMFGVCIIYLLSSLPKIMMKTKKMFSFFTHLALALSIRISDYSIQKFVSSEPYENIIKVVDEMSFYNLPPEFQKYYDEEVT